MATVVITQVDRAVANRSVTFIATVTNTTASALTLTTLAVSESRNDAIIGQPNYLTTNVAVGAGNPTLGAGASASYPFKVVFPAPNTAGVSPNAPSPIGISGMTTGQPASPSYTLQAEALTSDGVVGSSSLVVPVLSATDPFPRPEGGALQFSQGSNLINGIIMGVL